MVSPVQWPLARSDLTHTASGRAQRCSTLVVTAGEYSERNKCKEGLKYLLFYYIILYYFKAYFGLILSDFNGF